MNGICPGFLEYNFLLSITAQQTPFRIEFLSDNFEVGGAATAEAAGGNTGFKIRYWQSSC